ncbi:PREDICTED: uncharacterized protein LOC106749387, partial [Dinoponera quadriceps]|uniref:Uncharacterized protein LOC106749387 n=1 Tax=Dinoponera quadriceps TaxID=609295 RepID=A0A6P3Y0D0_DINQU
MNDTKTKLAHVLQLLNEVLMDLNNVLKFCSDIKSKKWESRQWFVRPINSTRIEKGLFSTTFQEMKEDPDLFFQYSRMDLETFTYLKHLLKKSLRKRKRVDVISVEERLILTIRYLASGDEIISLAIQHRIGEST